MTWIQSSSWIVIPGKIFNIANVKEIDGQMDFCFDPNIDNLKPDIDVK